MFNIINTTTFSEVIKGSFLDKISENQLSTGNAIAALLVSLILGVCIYFVYKLTYRGVVYSATFNASIILMTVISTAIIVTISSNVVLSLGMVGALSIVRFRSAIKDPIDIMYLFWAISVGIITGAQQYVFAIITTVVLAVVCFLLCRTKATAQVYLLVVRYDSQIAASMNKYIDSTKGKVRSKVATADTIELTVEYAAKRVPENAVEKLSAQRGVLSAVLVNYNGEYAD